MQFPTTYRNYCWHKGVPKGQERLPEERFFQEPESFRILDDPYHKRYTVELYAHGLFQEVVYDSLLLDFRHLKPAQQQGWRKELWKEQEGDSFYLIRSQEERIVYIERHQMRDGLCRFCTILSPHGLTLSTHRLYYTQCGDPFNGVILFDRTGRVVMRKEYACDASNEFTTLLQEEWVVAENPLPR